MTTSTLDIFALRDSVVDEYKHFATSFTTIHAPDIKAQVEAIYAQARYWPEPLIQINPSYKRSTDVGSLVDAGVLDPGCADDLPGSTGEPLTPLQAPGAGHRAGRGRRELSSSPPAPARASRSASSSPSSTACWPRSATSGQARTRAIIIYPMNALAN